MVYILLNVFLCIQLFFVANLVDRRIRDEAYDTSGISVSLLLCTVETVLFALILILKDLWLTKFTAQIMKLVMSIDSISIIMLSFSFLSLSKKEVPVFAKIFRYLLYIFIIYINFFRILDYGVRLENGVTILQVLYCRGLQVIISLLPGTHCSLYLQKLLPLFLDILVLWFVKKILQISFISTAVP